MCTSESDWPEIFRLQVHKMDGKGQGKGKAMGPVSLTWSRLVTGQTFLVVLGSMEM